MAKKKGLSHRHSIEVFRKQTRRLKDLSKGVRGTDRTKRGAPRVEDRLYGEKHPSPGALRKFSPSPARARVRALGS